MADVTGQIGSEPVVLNNAATEATLRQLVSAVGLLASKTKTSIKSQADFEKELNRFVGKVKQAGQAGKQFGDGNLRAYLKQKQLTQAVEETTVAMEEQSAGSINATQAIHKLAGAFTATVQKISSVATGLSNMGDSITSATGMFGQIPVVGSTISAVFDPIAGAVDSVYKSFKTAASVGATFDGNIHQMIESASAAGLTIDQYSSIVAQNGEALMLLGGSTTEGAKRLAEMGKIIRTTGINNELARMGYSTTDINEGLLRHTKLLARTGNIQNMSTQEINMSTVQYLRNLDAVSKLTGQQKEALQAQMDALMADSQYRMMMSKMDPTGALELEKAMAQMPAELRTGVKEIVATGTATSKEAEAIYYMFPQLAEYAVKTHQQIEQTGTMAVGTANALHDVAQKEAKALSKTPLGDTFAKFGDGIQQKMMVGAYNFEARQKTAAEVEEAAIEERRIAAENAAKGIGLDPGLMLNFEQGIAQLSNTMKQGLATAESLKVLKDAFESVAPTVVDTLIPVMQWAASNMDKLVAAAVAAALALNALAAKSFWEQVKSARAGKAAGPTAAGGAGAAGPKGGAARPTGGAAPAAAATPKAGPKINPAKGLKAASIGGITSIVANQAADAVGRDTTAGKALSVLGTTTEYASYGAMIGSIIPGVGTAVGGGVGAAAGFAKGMWDEYFSGVQEQTEADLQKVIQEETARIERSKTQDEYWGSEEEGRKESEAKIAEAKSKLALLRQRKEMDALVREAEQNQSPVPQPEVQASPVPKETTSTSTQQKSLEEAAAAKQKAAEDAARKAKEAEDLYNQNRSTDGAEGASLQKDSVRNLAEISTDIKQVAHLLRQQNELSKRQLSVQEGMSGDLFA